jgi:hypothetical protein
MTEKERELFFREKFEKFYNQNLVHCPLLVDGSRTIDFLNLVKEIAIKDAPLTLCKSSFYYNTEILEKYKNQIITYNFNLPMGTYQVILQINRNFHILLTLSSYEKPDFDLGFVPFFSFNDGKDYLEFLKENLSYENYAETQEKRAGFNHHIN